MILMFIGAIVGLLGIYFSVNGNNAVLIAGVIVFVFGAVISTIHTDKVKARRNIREYWANGKRPDWAEKDEPVYKDKPRYGLRIVAVLIVIIAAVFMMLIRK